MGKLPPLAPSTATTTATVRATNRHQSSATARQPFSDLLFGFTVRPRIVSSSNSSSTSTSPTTLRKDSVSDGDCHPLAFDASVAASLVSRENQQPAKEPTTETTGTVKDAESDFYSCYANSVSPIYLDRSGDNTESPNFDVDDRESIASTTAATYTRRTMYEEFRSSFPGLVRENDKTRKREQAAQRRILEQMASSHRESRSASLSSSDCAYVGVNGSGEMEENAKIQRTDSMQSFKVPEKDILAKTLQQNDDDVNNISSFLKFSSNHCTETCIKTLTGHQMPVTCLDFEHPHGVLLTGSEDSTLKLWDLSRWDCVKTLRAHRSAVRCVQVRDQIAVSGGDDTCAVVWNIPNIDQTPLSYFEHSLDEDWIRCNLHGHVGSILCLQMEKGCLMTGSADHTVRIWDLNTEQCVSTLRYQNSGESSSLDDISTSKQGLASLSQHSAPNNILHFTPPTSGGVGSLQFYENALATGSQDGIIRLWDTRQQQCVRHIAAHTLPITRIQFDPNGYTLMSSSMDRSLRVWDLRFGTAVERFVTASGQGILDFQFNNDRVAVAAGDESITVCHSNFKNEQERS